MSAKDPIVIVGVGGIFPGAANLDDFWGNIKEAISVAKEVPQGRWFLTADEAYDPEIGKPDKVYSKRGCFIEDFILDQDGLDINPDFVAQLDPLFHIALHAGHQAFLDAVTENIDRSRIGVIIGNIALPTEKSSALARDYLGRTFEEQILKGDVRSGSTLTNPINRYVTGLPSGVLAKALGLGGGSYTLDAACASSLYALKVAVDELRTGRADAMLTGGLSRPDCLYTQMGFSQLRALSATGCCAPFDKKGNGLVVGEGAGMFLLKRLSDALRDGDHIYAVIRGIGLSNDVEGNLLAPDLEGQVRAMRPAYQQADWDPNDVDLIECHGTGTPVGDAIEIESLKNLWGGEVWDVGQCVIGSVKSNVGHLLTGAGAAGLMKALLALKHHLLPPTANFEQAPEEINLAETPFQVLSSGREWSQRDEKTPRRAAVSSFGFGGINAHVLLEEYLPTMAEGRKKVQSDSLPAIAIIGMEAKFGPWNSLRAFQERVLGRDDFVEQRQPRWWGAEKSRWFRKEGLQPISGYYVDTLQVPRNKYHIPPKELEEMLPQQLLMLDVAAGALSDAGIQEGPHHNTGVFIGIGLDLNTTNFHFRWSLLKKAREWNLQLGLNLSQEELDEWVQKLRDASGPALTANRTMGALGGIVASRVAREFRIGGPSFTISSEESSGLSALEVAVRSLQNRDIDNALVGAVDLAGDLRSVLATNANRSFSPSGSIRPFDDNADGTVPGEGGCAVILKRFDDAIRDDDKIYAVIKGVGAAAGGDIEQGIPRVETYKLAMERAYDEAQIKPESVDYIETHGSGYPAEDRMEAAAISEFCSAQDEAVSYTLGCVKADIGHTGAAGGLASLIKASLCLYQEILPSLRNIQTSSLELTSHPLKCRLPRSPQYWLHNRADGPRRAGVSSFSINGNCHHILLESCDSQKRVELVEERLQPLGVRSTALFAIEGDSVSELHDGLDRLQSLAKAGSDVEVIARKWWKEEFVNVRKIRGISLVVKSHSELIKHIQEAHHVLDTAAPHPSIFFSPVPIGLEGGIAFVFPGLGNHFADMGRTLGVEWPEIFRQQDLKNQYLRNQYVLDKFWYHEAQARPHVAQTEYVLSHVSLGTAVSDLVRGFGVEPTAAIGYSVGETAACFAFDVWMDRDEMLRRMWSSTLFRSDVGGEYRALRKHWKLQDNDKTNWAAGVVDRGPDVIREKIRDKKHLYILVINTATECVVGGDKDALMSLVKELDCHFFPLEGIPTVHCDIVREVADEYYEFHHFKKVNRPKGITFYSGAWGRSYQVTSKSIADSILAQALKTFDFPSLIEASYNDGVRVFLEMGPGTSCTRMIHGILADRPHVARSACVADQDAATSVLYLLAQLIAERVPVKLDGLYGNETVALRHYDIHKSENENVLRVDVGGNPFSVELPRRMDPVMAKDVNPSGSVVTQMTATDTAKTNAHRAFLRFSENISRTMSQNLAFQMTLIDFVGASPRACPTEGWPQGATPTIENKNVFLDRGQCLEFAKGKIAHVLGDEFAEIDSHPTRVRLPDEPLMLVDRILSVEGEARSLKSGRVLTEHDIHADAWYLDGACIPTSIAVEAGQADLFLSGYLGIDFETKGLAMYRLLDAEVIFHRRLPGPGAVIRYDIHIERFFRQGETYLFRFHFEGTVNGEPLLTMKNGCAGFFAIEELERGEGVVQTELDLRPIPGVVPDDWEELVPMDVEKYSDEQITALRGGRLADCFGNLFSNLDLKDPVRLPDGLMTLVDRVVELDPKGGRYGLGLIRAEADIRPDDWFLSCHFIDDRVMPGTLMYECCLHTLRIFLMRMGWLGEQNEVRYEPVPGVASALKCRGQVIESTKKVIYEISIKELGFHPEPYAIADALMYADEKAIVEIKDMSVQLSGLNQEQIRVLWKPQENDKKPAIFDHDRILACAMGKPSEAFGEPYKVFDEERVMARLPRYQLQLVHRATEINAEQWKMQSGGVIEVQYDIPPDAWYFKANRQPTMPFAILLEIAIQPCGWLAAYIGTALMSDIDLSFRNLGGRGVQYKPVFPETGTLTTKLKITNVSNSAGMILQNYEFEVKNRGNTVYSGDTYFGFFSKETLADQIGIQGAQPYQPTELEIKRGLCFDYPDDAPFPNHDLQMLDKIDLFVPDGGPKGLGFIRGIKEVDPTEWFFEAHFYQDPVMPGSLGLEAFLQLLKVVACERWGPNPDYKFETVILEKEHQWVYRGQVIRPDKRVTVQAVVTSIDDDNKQISADGYLIVDGRIIYQMKDFTLKIKNEGL